MNILLCFAGAALAGLSFLFDKLYILLFFAPALFFISIYDENKPFLKGFIFGSTFYIFNSLFLSSLDVSYATTDPLMLKILPLIAYVAVFAIEGLFMGIFTKVFIIIKKQISKKYYPLVFSSIWVIYEYLIGLHFSDAGYNWGRISVPLASCPALIQTASLFGMLFISFIIIYFASSMAMSYIEKTFNYMIFPCILLTLNLIFSVYLYTIPEKGDAIKVKCVQNGYGGYEKWQTPLSEIVDHSIEEISSADAELVLFAESAIPTYLNLSSYPKIFQTAAENNDVTILVGGLYADSDGKNYTSIYYYPDADGKIYHKRHPVPYGEYYPILDIFSPELKKEGLSKGQSPVILSDYKIAPIVCFDSIFPLYARESVNDGAEILCISTNDSWFSKGNAAQLHLYHSVYRAIENGRYVARSACTGISAFVDTKGNILGTIPLNEVGSLTKTVLLSDEITTYALWGDTPILLYAVSVIAVSIFQKKRRIKNAG